MAIWNWRYHCAAVGKRSLMYFGMFGLATYLCDTIFLDRFDRAKAVQQMNAVVDQIQSKKVSGYQYQLFSAYTRQGHLILNRKELSTFWSNSEKSKHKCNSQITLLNDKQFSLSNIDHFFQSFSKLLSIQIKSANLS